MGSVHQSHYYYPIFPQGTPYPCRRSLVLQVANPEQTEIQLEVEELTECQGKIAYDYQGRMLGGQGQGKFKPLGKAQRFLLKPAGMDRLELSCEIDIDRHFLITARDLLTQKPIVAL